MTPFTKLSPQQQTVYDYLTIGRRTLTNLIAITTLGIQSLSKRISELRAKGLEDHLAANDLMLKSVTKQDHRGRKYKAHQVVAKGD